MKKNFFKKLATVLSLAMVVTSVAPLAGTSASAAATPDIKTRRTTAYEGNSYSYAVKNAKGYTVKWAVSGKLATISKAGKLTVKTKGAKAGTVVVSAAFYKNGKKVVTRKDSVAIKVSAKSVAITTKADVTALGVGEVADFNRKLTPSNATSKTYYSVTAKDGAATTDATIDSVGKFTATKAGEYVVTATVRNAKTSKVVATTTANVTAVIKIQSVKQTAINKVQAVFGADVSKIITKSNIAVEAKDTKANAYVKSVSFSADGKTATLEVYNNFVDKKAYTVTYDKKVVEFVASVGEVASVVVKDKTVKYAEPTALDITLVDANGIDVTTDTEMAKVSAKTTNNVGWVDLVNGGKVKITLYNIGDVATVTATYATGKFDTAGKSIDVVSASATITAVKELAAEGTVSDYSAVVSNVNKSLDWSKSVKKIGVKDYGQLYVKGAVNGTTFDSAVLANDAIDYESSNSNILLVDKLGRFTAVSEGTAYVTAKYNNYTAVFAIEVGAERKAAAISVDKGSVSLSGHMADDATVKVTVKDQYGDDRAAESVDVTRLVSPKDDVLTYDDTVLGKVKFESTTANQEGTYQYKLTTDGLSIRVDVIVSKAGSSTAVATYRIIQSNADFDLKVDANTNASASNDIKVAQYNAAGVKIGYETTSTTKVTVTHPNGKDTTVGTSGVVSVPLLDVNATAITKSAVTGTYNIKVEVVENSKLVVRQTGTFTVKDTQVLPTVAIDKIQATKINAISGELITATLVKNCVTNNVISAVLGSEKFEDGVATSTISGAGLMLTGVDAASVNGSIDSTGHVIGAPGTSHTIFIKTLTFTGKIGARSVNYTVTVNYNMTFAF